MFKAFNVVVLSLSAALLVISCGKNETTPENTPVKAASTPTPAATPEYAGVWYGDCVVEGANSSQLSLISGPNGASIVTTTYEASTSCAGDKVLRVEATSALEIGEKITVSKAVDSDVKVLDAEVTGNAYKASRNAITEAIASISPLALESANTNGFCGKKDWSIAAESYKLSQAIPAAELVNCSSLKAGESFAAYIERIFPIEKNSKKVSYLVVINGDRLMIVQEGENGQPSLSLPVMLNKNRVSQDKIAPPVDGAPITPPSPGPGTTVGDVGKPGPRPVA